MTFPVTPPPSLCPTMCSSGTLPLNSKYVGLCLLVADALLTQGSSLPYSPSKELGPGLIYISDPAPVYHHEGRAHSFAPGAPRVAPGLRLRHTPFRPLSSPTVGASHPEDEHASTAGLTTEKSFPCERARDEANRNRGRPTPPKPSAALLAAPRLTLYGGGGTNQRATSPFRFEVPDARLTPRAPSALIGCVRRRIASVCSHTNTHTAGTPST
ncbi:unnamed protein product [Rangifer tarandus platyrhynchus]|uniref:Uncharacterized protein n=1 Tax=Rangifer tarandus platyrhynchus TaxID=3082113 RepID=A0AC59Z3H8_RANTA